MTTHKIDGHTIHTNHDFPPIPIRSFDWSAVLDGYDGAPDAGPQLVGTGRTEQEAIDNLLELIAEHDDDYAREAAADRQREERAERALEERQERLDQEREEARDSAAEQELDR